MWPVGADIECMRIRLRILQKKAMMTIIIKDYAFLDRLLRRSITFLNILSFTISFIISTIDIPNQLKFILTIIIGIVAIITRLKDFIKIHRIRDSAKLQYAKYDNLSQKILDEVNKPNDIKNNYLEFINNIENEFRLLSFSDPILSYKQKIIYKKECEKLGVPILEDNEELVELSNQIHRQQHL